MIAQAFFPPEMQAEVALDEMNEMEAPTDIRTEEMRRLFFQSQTKTSKKITQDSALVELVLDHAKNIVAHPSKPVTRRLESFSRFPFSEIALEESLEENPIMELADDYLVEIQTEKQVPCVTLLDCSYSMAGEKHLLASVAVAVLLLECSAENAGVITFSSSAESIKALRSNQGLKTTLYKFLNRKPKGFTNIAKGLEQGLKEYDVSGRVRRKVGLIATDGRSTEGGDPMEVAKLYDYLVVLHLQGPGSHLEASQELAKAGKGTCLEVETFEALPKKLYDALRLVMRA